MGLDIPTSLGLPFVIRTYLPGLVGWSLVGYVLLPAVGYHTANFGLDQQLVLFAIAPLVMGITLFSMDYRIYTFYEGRFYWPKFLSDRMTRRLQSKIDAMLARTEKIKQDRAPLRQLVRANTATTEQKMQFSKLNKEYDELWFKLRVFPQEGPTRFAAYPTMMGNMFDEAELYPRSRYGMDSIFFWPKLVLLMSKDQMQLVDETKAQVDFLTYTSFFFLLYTPVHFLVFGFSGNYTSAWLGLFGLPAAYLLYRASLNGLRGYLDEFKSVFDIERQSLRSLVEVSVKDQAQERFFWNDVWRVLQYGKPPKGHNVIVMMTLVTGDPATEAEELKKAGLLTEASPVKGDYQLMGTLSGRTAADALSKVSAIKKRPEIASIAHVLQGG